MNNLIKKLLLLITLLLLFTKYEATAQNEISIEQCYEWTRENYPLIKQLNIIDKTTSYNIKNVAKGNMPQLALNGQASYQSAVTELPISLPNIDIPSISKDQYKLYAEFYQPLTNFNAVSTKKSQLKASGEIEKQQIEVALHQLKERINQVYFGILLINEKNQQLEIIKKDLDSALEKISIAIENGIATETDKQLINVEKISLIQQIEENSLNKKAFLYMLSILTAQDITEKTTLITPKIEETIYKINRPELHLFDLQNNSISIIEKNISNSLIPNIGLFGQAGYGRPALNFLSNDFNGYYIGGLKLNWNLTSLYTFKNSKKSNAMSIDKIETQREVFLLNIKLAETQQSLEIDKFNALINTDIEIIKARETILNTANFKLNNGLITTLDYLTFLNEVSKARQTLLLHKTQLLLAQYNLKTTTGN